MLANDMRKMFTEKQVGEIAKKVAGYKKFEITVSPDVFVTPQYITPTTDDEKALFNLLEDVYLNNTVIDPCILTIKFTGQPNIYASGITSITNFASDDNVILGIPFNKAFDGEYKVLCVSYIATLQLQVSVTILL